MARAVLILDRARDDMDMAHDFYDRCEIGVGDYFIDCILSDISSLKFYFGLHRMQYGFHRLSSKRFPYSIYYEVEEEVVRIVAVLDMRMKPSIIRELVNARREDG